MIDQSLGKVGQQFVRPEAGRLFPGELALRDSYAPPAFINVSSTQRDGRPPSLLRKSQEVATTALALRRRCLWRVMEG